MHSMTVYKFYSAKSGIRNLAKSRLKVSKLPELNDPFEFAGIDLRQKDIRKKFDGWRKKEGKNTGLISFCRSHYNPLMWAHYADEHRGICMEFDVPKPQLKWVNYVNQRDRKIDCPDFFKTMKGEDRERLLTMKFSHWAYEQELRLIVRLKKCIASDGMHFIDFGDTLKLTKLFLGYRFDQYEKLKHILANWPELPVRKKRPAFGTFKIVQQMDWRMEC